MNKKINIMSLSVEPEMQERMKVAAKKKQISVSKLVRELVDRHMEAETPDELTDTIILKVPKEIKKDGEKLRAWLDHRFNGIVSALVKS